MITLFTFPEGLNQPSLSPFCTKTIYLLDMADAEWQRKDVMNPGKMPHGKLPVIEWRGQLIPDSHLIQAALTDAGADFYPGLGAHERALGQSITRMLEDIPRCALVYDRWLLDDAWAICRESFFKTLPAPMLKPVSAMVRRGVRRGLMAHGIARCTEGERMALVDQDLIALANLLGDTPLLFSDQFTAADAAALAVLGAIDNLPVETPLRSRLRSDPRLMQYLHACQEAVSDVSA